MAALPSPLSHAKDRTGRKPEIAVLEIRTRQDDDVALSPEPWKDQLIPSLQELHPTTDGDRKMRPVELTAVPDDAADQDLSERQPAVLRSASVRPPIAREVTVLGQVLMEGCALVEVRAVLDTEIHDDIAGDRGALPGADRYGHRRLSAVEPTEPSGGRVRRGDIEPMVVGARSRRSEQH